MATFFDGEKVLVSDSQYLTSGGQSTYTVGSGKYAKITIFEITNGTSCTLTIQGQTQTGGATTFDYWSNLTNTFQHGPPTFIMDTGDSLSVTGSGTILFHSLEFERPN